MAKEGGTEVVVVGEKIKRKGKGGGPRGEGLKDVVPGLEKEELTCPAGRPVYTAGRTPILTAAQCC